MLKTLGAVSLALLASCSAGCGDARRTEALMRLRQIANGAVAFFSEERMSPGMILAPGSAMAVANMFPPPAPLTPASDCCASKGVCAPDPAAWQAAGWRALRFEMNGPHRYRYEFSSSGVGRDARFTARAVPACGPGESYEVSGSVSPEGSVIVGEIRAVR